MLGDIMPNVEMSQKFEIAFFTIATNNYVEYWAELIGSADAVFFPENRVCFVVFTDDVSESKRLTAHIKNVTVRYVQIEPLGWPEATLLRYSVYAENVHTINANIYSHIDADMLFIDNPLKFTNPEDWVNGVALVLHPGYFRGNSNAVSKKLRFKDRIMRIWMGGLGTWETRKSSKAFVKRGLRQNYYCGGFWMGKSAAFTLLVSKLQAVTQCDLDLGIIAKWHDESYLNSWASLENFTSLSPSFCYDSTYPWLNGLPEIIRAVRKS